MVHKFDTKVLGSNPRQWNLLFDPR